MNLGEEIISATPKIHEDTFVHACTDLYLLMSADEQKDIDDSIRREMSLLDAIIENDTLKDAVRKRAKGMRNNYRKVVINVD